MMILIAQLVAASNAVNMTVECTTKPSPENRNSINILTETFDLIDNETGRWQGTLTLYPNGQIMVEKDGKHNWTDRYASISEFRRNAAKKKIA